MLINVQYIPNRIDNTPMVKVYDTDAGFYRVRTLYAGRKGEYFMHENKRVYLIEVPEAFRWDIDAGNILITNYRKYKGERVYPMKYSDN